MKAAVWSVFVLVASLLGLVVGADAATLTVRWTAPSTNANGTPLTDLAGYRLYIGTSTPTCPGSSYHAIASSTTSPLANQTVSATLTNLNPGATYWVRISAVDRNGNQSACSPTASGVAKGALNVSPTGAVNFGSLLLGAFLDRTYTVQNTSGASVSGGASVGSPFSIVSGASFTLAAGASTSVVVRFRPLALGSFASNVNFTAQGETVSRAVSGSVTGSDPAPPASTPTLSVSRTGSGSGTVNSSPSGIACGTDCSQTYVSGTRVTLTASAASGSVFAGWSGGGCAGTGTCSVTVNTLIGVTATFNSTTTTTRTLTVSRSGSGTGTVTSAPAGITCGTDCTQAYTYGTRVTLTASAASGSVFGGWSGGGCTGTGTCSVTLNAATGVTATFNPATSTSRPDLIVSSLSIPSTVYRGGSYTLSFGVKNQGSVTSAATQLRIHMSVNSSLSSDDALLQTRSLSTIAAGATVSRTLTGTIPSGAPAGVYYMILAVDPNGAVAESNEGNNTLVRAITVR